MKLYIYKNKIYHQCVSEYRSRSVNYSDYAFYSSEYKIRNGEAKCQYCSFTAPGFLFISKVISNFWVDHGILPEGGKWLEL